MSEYLIETSEHPGDSVYVYNHGIDERVGIISRDRISKTSTHIVLTDDEALELVEALLDMIGGD